LRILRVWKQLPESDITRMLHNLFLVTDDYREMEEQGFITLSFLGDEYLVAPTTLGKIWLEEYEKEEKHHAI